MKTKPKNRKLTKAQCSRKPKHITQRVNEYFAQQEREAKLEEQRLLSKKHTFSMEFCLEDVRKKFEEFHTQHNLKMDMEDKGVFIPETVVMDAYHQHDLIIALKMQQVDCQDWFVGIDTHFYNYETDEVKTVPYQVEPCGMTYQELQTGSKVKVLRDGGFKTRWLGLERERERHFEDMNLDGFKIIKTMVKITGYCTFKTLALRDEFLLMQGLRNEGRLIDFTDGLTKQLIDDGKLDYQLQPIDVNNMAIPAAAFDKLRSEHKPKSIQFKDLKGLVSA